MGFIHNFHLGEYDLKVIENGFWSNKTSKLLLSCIDIQAIFMKYEFKERKQYIVNIACVALW